MAYNIIGGYPDVLRLKAHLKEKPNFLDDDIVAEDVDSVDGGAESGAAADSDSEDILGGTLYETFIGGLIAVADGVDDADGVDADGVDDAQHSGGDEKHPDVTSTVEPGSSAEVLDPDMSMHDKIANDSDIVDGGDDGADEKSDIVDGGDEPEDIVDAHGDEPDDEPEDIVDAHGGDEPAEDSVLDHFDSSSSSETSDGESSDDEKEKPKRKIERSDNVAVATVAVDVSAAAASTEDNSDNDEKGSDSDEKRGDNDVNTVIVLEDEDAPEETTGGAVESSSEKLIGADELREVLGGYFEIP